jgi:hypothetical protein
MVLVKLSKWLLVLALCASIGAHWAFLQSVAWVGMAITYSQVSSSFTETLAKTFDGKHPCKLCKLVTEGKKSQKKQEAQFKTAKLDLLSAVRSNFVFNRPAPANCVSAPTRPSDHNEPPPTPPPRLTRAA